MVKHGIREAGSIDVSAAMALGYASQTAFAMAFRRLTRRNPEQLATARTLTAISLQVPQSLWGGGGPGSLGSSTSTANATMKSDPYCRLQHFSTEGLDMRDDDCCRLQRRSFLTTMAGITTAAAFTATGAGTDPQVDFMKIWEARCRRSTGGGIRYPVCHRVRVPHPEAE